jgi:hypothetical protein
VAIEDLNGDGVGDVVVVNSLNTPYNAGQPNQLFIGDGAGGLVELTASPIASGSDDSRGVAIGDVNGDGFKDVVVVNSGQANQLFMGDGAGGFVESTNSPIASGSDDSRGVAIGDVNGDSFYDVVVVNFEQANQLFVGDGAGGLVESGDSPIAIHPPWYYGVPHCHQCTSGTSLGVAIDDVNGDGCDDVVVVNSKQPNQLFMGSATGLFEVTDSPISSNTNIYPYHTSSTAVAIGDVNADGAADIVVANSYWNGQENLLFIGDGAGGFVRNTDSPIGNGGDSSEGVVIGDINGDGIADVVVVNSGACSAARCRPYNLVFIADGAGGLVESTDSPLSTGTDDSMAIAVGDVTGDGVGDVVVVNRAPNGQPSQANQLFVNANAGGLMERTGSLIASGTLQSSGVVIGDLTGDGLLDMVVLNPGQANQLFVGDGGGGFALSSDSPVSDRTADNGQQGDGRSEAAAIGDVNGDGVADLVVVNRCGNIGYYGYTNRLFLGDRTGGLVESDCSTWRQTHASCSSVGTSTSYGVAIGDVNLDGTADVVVANVGPPHHNQLFLGGDGCPVESFDSPISSGMGKSFWYRYGSAVAIGDITGDGAPDVVVASPGAVNQLFIGDGVGGLVEITNNPIASGSDASDKSNGVAIEDLNGDGVGDVIVVNAGQPNQLFIGDGAGGLVELTASPIASGSGDSRGVAIGDVNGDGFKDVVVVNSGQEISCSWETVQAGL